MCRERTCFTSGARIFSARANLLRAAVRVPRPQPPRAQQVRRKQTQRGITDERSRPGPGHSTRPAAGRQAAPRPRFHGPTPWNLKSRSLTYMHMHMYM